MRKSLARFSKSPAGMAGLCLVIFMILIAILGPAIAPYKPDVPNYADILKPPTLAHLGGTDEFGRDIFSRVLYGARISLSVGVLGVVVGIVPGTVLGLTSGYYGGWFDDVVMRVVDVLLAFPGILLAIAMVAILGANLVNIVLAIGFFGVPTFTRIVRGSTLQAKELEYVEGAHAQGARTGRILWRHILPNILTPLIVIATLQIANAILTESALSFLGLGARPPTPEWGAMLSDAQDYLATGPYMAFLPGLALVLSVLGFNLLGDGLRDALDPRLRT